MSRPAHAFHKIRSALTICAVAFSVPALGQQSGGAVAPPDEFAMTPAEAEQRAQACAIPEPYGQMEFATYSLGVVALPAYRFVTLVEQGGEPAKGSASSRSQEPPEKMAFADLCGSAVVADMGGEAPGDRLRFSLRVRPGLDIGSAYPRTFASPGLETGLEADYMMVPWDAPGPGVASRFVRAFVTNRASDPRFDQSGLAFWFRGVLFIPLKSNDTNR